MYGRPFQYRQPQYRGTFRQVTYSKPKSPALFDQATAVGLTQDGKLFTKFRVVLRPASMDWPSAGLFIYAVNGNGNTFSRTTPDELRQLGQWLVTQANAIEPSYTEQNTKGAELATLKHAAESGQLTPEVAKRLQDYIAAHPEEFTSGNPLEEPPPYDHG